MLGRHGVGVHPKKSTIIKEEPEAAGDSTRSEDGNVALFGVSIQSNKFGHACSVCDKI